MDFMKIIEKLYKCFFFFKSQELTHKWQMNDNFCQL